VPVSIGEAVFEDKGEIFLEEKHHLAATAKMPDCAP